MIIQTADLRRGMKVKYEGKLYSVASAEHIKPGKGNAFSRIKMKDIESGSVLDRTFKVGEKIETAFVEKRPAAYSYKSGDDFVFMDAENYEQVTMTAEQLGDDALFLIPDLEVQLMLCEDKVVGLELPNFVEQVIVETEPGCKGDTVSGATKLAKLEGGATVMVPLFVNQGTKVRVDTRTGDYVERV